MSLIPPVIISLFIASAWMLTGGWKTTEDRAAVFTAPLILLVCASLLTAYRIIREIDLPASVETNGTITMSRQWGKRRAIMVDTKYGRFVAYANAVDAFEEGSRIYVRGALFDFKRARRGGFDERLYWRSKGAVKKLTVLEMKTIGRPTGIYRWRNFLRERIKYVLPFNMSAYMLALTVGERDKQLTEIHKITGTSHLLAVSGFHVGLLAAFVSLLFSKGKKRIIMVTAIMWLYIMLAGFPTSGIRAAIMVQIYLLGLLMGMPSSAFNSVSVAGVVMLLYDPWIFFDIGWQLSMLAALTICAVSLLTKSIQFKAAYASIVVWLITAPIVASAFKFVPAAGMLLNILAIPLFSLIFPLVILFSIPALAGFPFGNQLANIMEYFLESWEYLSEIVAKEFSIDVPFSYPMLVISITVFACLVSFASGIRREKFLLSSSIFSLTALLIIMML